MDLPGIATGIVPYASSLTMLADGAETAVPAERLQNLAIVPGDRVRAEVRNPRPPLVTGVESRRAYADYVMSLSPVAYWKCDEASGGLQDVSDYGHHMTVQANTLFQQGTGWDEPHNNCSLYSVGWAGNGYQGMPTDAHLNPDYDDDFTICFWLKPSSAGSFQHVISKYNAAPCPVLIYLTNDGYFRFYRVTSTGVSAYIQTPYSTSTWYFMLCRASGSYLNLLKDASWQTPVANVTSSCANSTDLFIGRQPGAASNYYNGFIDEIAWFDYALSDEQCLTMYCLGKALTPSGW